MATTIVTEGDKVIIKLFDGVIPPILGTSIGPQVIVVPKEMQKEYAGVAADVFENKTIQFPLEMPGGADVVENSDDWGIGALGLLAEGFWERGFKGKDVRIGIADSGLDSSLATFSSLRSDRRLLAFAAFNADGSKQWQHNPDPDGSTITDISAVPSATHWHGTFCAALLVGENDGMLRGMAPAAYPSVTEVLQTGNVGTVASISAGLQWLRSQKPDIASLSLGWPGKHEEWADDIEGLIEDGVVVVAAIGNEWGIPGEQPSRSPANYPIDFTDTKKGILISVGAHDQANKVADFSGGEVANWQDVVVSAPDGTKRPSKFASAPPKVVPAIVAPGVDIIEPVAPNRYESQSGSSMATPHIAGLLALVLSALRSKNQGASARNAAELLLECVIPLAAPADIRMRRGRVDPNLLLAKVDAALN